MVPEVVARLLEAAEALDAEVRHAEAADNSKRAAFLLKARVFLDNALNNTQAALKLGVVKVVAHPVAQGESVGSDTKVSNSQGGDWGEADTEEPAPE